MAPVSGRKINKHTKTYETYAIWHESYIILSNTIVKLHIIVTTHFSQGSAATDLRRGGSFNSSFLYTDPFWI